MGMYFFSNSQLKSAEKYWQIWLAMIKTMHGFDYKWTLTVAVGNFKVRMWWVCSSFQLKTAGYITWKSAGKCRQICFAKILKQCTVLIINGL